eukprot:CAMPEP_0203915052 /NCGR_PEP_ID=MMETSP0359-20131031/55890_1 /ASSEMBLY_ACC=CAM_ASM_000338 /TAXON_ID=268821 /ORGANISM="Scrippsiella Hangoei, Strain SHTV-5" /LENGTH=56 /DNA_ID=CAMNT_0050841493 /DNA_START=21 /DNA_END=188 /DNA_ORIENTATION=-
MDAERAFLRWKASRVRSYWMTWGDDGDYDSEDVAVKVEQRREFAVELHFQAGLGTW